MLNLNGRDFAFGIIPPFEAIRVEVAVARVIGEPLFKAFMDGKKTGNAEEDVQHAGATAIGVMLMKMDADEIIATMEIVFKYVTVDGKRADITADFNGKNKELWQVFIAALRHNFSDFLPAGLFDSIRKGKPASN